MRIMVLLTTTYPYDKGEEFLANELDAISGFDQVIIVPCKLKPDSVQTRPLPKNIRCIPIPPSFLGQNHMLYVRLWFNRIVQKEVNYLRKTGRRTFKHIHEMLYFMKNARRIYDFLYTQCVGCKGDEVVLYSYWMYDLAVAACMLRPALEERGLRVRILSRAHGFDLYQERNALKYLPMRPYLLRELDAVYPCSEDGARVLREYLPQEAHKVVPAFLGTKDYGVGHPSRLPEFHLVSCSYLSPVKRVELILEALSGADFPIRWTHIGSGDQLEQLETQAESLPTHVKAEFLGHMDNSELMRYYQTQTCSAFVNVSASEGIPVSIMEACSFGLPILATDVGGSREAVHDGENGILLQKNLTASQLLAAICSIYKMPEKNFLLMCRNSRKIWETQFSADTNYQKFYMNIRDLFEA